MQRREDSVDPGTTTVIGLCAFLVLWYGVGSIYNRHLGRRLYLWLESGLAVLGGRREASWIGSLASGARIHITRAEPPFARLEITLLLARREIPLLWLIDHLRGKRDKLIIRATLRSPRRGEIEVYSPGSNSRAPRTGNTPYPQQGGWTDEQGPWSLSIAWRGKGVEDQLAGLKPWLERYGAHLQRLSWQRHDPHLQLQMDPTRLVLTPSATLLTDLQIALIKIPYLNK
jgi:hypothetical protein